MLERVQKTKCRGCCGKQLRGDAGEAKEDKMRGGGLREKFEGAGMPEMVNKMECGRDARTI